MAAAAWPAVNKPTATVPLGDVGVVPVTGTVWATVVRPVMSVCTPAAVISLAPVSVTTRSPAVAGEAVLV